MFSMIGLLISGFALGTLPFSFKCSVKAVKLLCDHADEVSDIASSQGQSVQRILDAQDGE